MSNSSEYFQRSCNHGHAKIQTMQTADSVDHPDCVDIKKKCKSNVIKKTRH